MVGISSPTPGPWDYVPSTEHHGPYVTSEFGTTVADCYVMSRPGSLSVRNGGDSKPIHHMAEMADANARLIAAAPDLLEALQVIRMSAGWDHLSGESQDLIAAALSKAQGTQS